MRFLKLKLLADENISPRVVTYLRHQGIDVFDVKETGLNGSTDDDLIRLAFNDNRYVLTHDADFGTLCINSGVPCYGVLYLRLKRPSASNVIDMLVRFCDMNIDVAPNSLVVVNEGRIRIRRL
jgi:predicted nuclease of predicted toxin-antitoxin system